MSPTCEPNGPAGWQVEAWTAPSILPPVIDYPEDYLPDRLPDADLLLAFGEQRGIAELIPDIARLCGARAVIAPIDSEAWLPRGLARQLRGWLEQMGIVCVTPKPLCSLTETNYALTRRQRIQYNDPLIAEFARYFGQPEMEISIDPETRLITSARVTARRGVRLRPFRGRAAGGRLCRRCRTNRRDAPPPLSLPGEHGQRPRLR